MKPNRELSICLLVMLLMSAVPAPQHHVWAQKIKLTNTLLDVKRPDDPSKPWGNGVVINTLQVVLFRWKTTDQDVRKAIWQVSEENLGLAPYPKGVIAQGSAGTNLFNQFGNTQYFQIDFKTLPSSYVPQSPPTTPKVYWVRVMPQNNAGQFTGTISMSMRITYQGTTYIAEMVETPRGTYAEISFTTTTPTIPIVEASTKVPVAGPAFNAGDVQSSAFPLLAGYQKNHKVRLDNLKPDTLYHYVIRVKDEKGSVARKLDNFTTMKRHVTVTFQEIYVKDDSDDLSEGDFTFGFYLNGQLKYSPTVGLDTGQRLPLPANNYTASLVSPAEPFIIKVLGVDNDEIDRPFTLTSDIERYEALKPNFPGDAADGAGSFTFKTGPDEAFTQAFTIKANSAKLKFEVKGTFKVSYW